MPDTPERLNAALSDRCEIKVATVYLADDLGHQREDDRKVLRQGLAHGRFGQAIETTASRIRARRAD